MPRAKALGVLSYMGIGLPSSLSYVPPCNRHGCRFRAPPFDALVKGAVE